MPLLVVEAKVTAETVVCVKPGRIVVQVDLFIFNRPPQSLDEDIVQSTSTAVPADLHASVEKNFGEVGACELRALVGSFNCRITGIEDLRRTMMMQRFL